MAILVISHQMGAGGPEIGMALAQRLGYRYVNQELLLDAARRYGLAEGRLSHLDESKPTRFERFDTEKRHHDTVLQTTLLDVAEQEGSGLLGRGGTAVPPGLTAGIRLRVRARPRRSREGPPRPPRRQTAEDPAARNPAAPPVRRLIEHGGPPR